MRVSRTCFATPKYSHIRGGIHIRILRTFEARKASSNSNNTKKDVIFQVNKCGHLLNIRCCDKIFLDKKTHQSVKLIGGNYGREEE